MAFKNAAEERKHGSKLFQEQLDALLDFHDEHYIPTFLPEWSELLKLCVKKLKDMSENRNFETQESSRILCTLECLLASCLKEKALHYLMNVLASMVARLKHLDEELEEKAVEVTRRHMNASVDEFCEKLQEARDKASKKPSNVC